MVIFGFTFDPFGFNVVSQTNQLADHTWPTDQTLDILALETQWHPSPELGSELQWLAGPTRGASSTFYFVGINFKSAESLVQFFLYVTLKILFSFALFLGIFAFSCVNFAECGVD